MAMGRGGRGAALLAALQKQAGDSEEGRGVQQPGAMPTVGAAVPPVGRAGGRARALLAAAQQSVYPVPGAPAEPTAGGVYHSGGGDATAVALVRPPEAAVPRPGMGRAQMMLQQMRQHQPPGDTTLASQFAAQATVTGSTRVGTSPERVPGAPVRTPPMGVSPSHGERVPSQPVMGRAVEADMEVKKYIGVTGEKVDVLVNYIKLKTRDYGLYQYAVHYSPDIDSRDMRFSLLDMHREALGNTKTFDGSQLWLPIELPEQRTVFQSTRITDNEVITIEVVFVKSVRPGRCLQQYNILFRKLLRILKMTQVGRNYYDPKTPMQVPQHKIELWPGYITSIEEYDGGIMLLLDVSHKLLRTETVLQYMKGLYRTARDNFKETIYRQLVGQIVLTRYNNRTYKIDDIFWDKNPTCTFPTRQGGEKAYMDYYNDHYNVNISDLEQPLLVSNPKRRTQDGKEETQMVCLVPELCFMTGLTDAQRADFRVMKDVAVHTRVTPNQRLAVMRQFKERLYASNEARAEMEKWKVELDEDVLGTEARLLPQEKILLARKTVMSGPEADWTRDVVREPMITAVDLRVWSLFFVNRNESAAREFVLTLQKVAQQIGMNVNAPQYVALRDDRTETYVNNIKSSLTPDTQMVVTIFPTPRDDRYSAVKKLCYADLPVACQCINSKTISGQPNKLRSISQKIALQMNAKLGGELWAVDNPLRSTMVIGIDVYHDKAGGKSVAGVVSSLNKNFTRWFSRVLIQGKNQEIIDGLTMYIACGIKAWHDENHALPERIIVFRDGVGNGQLGVVRDSEVVQIRGTFASFGKDYDPKFAVVVVGKRINQRVYARRGPDAVDNPGSGTVVDQCITRVDLYDFYLISQHVRQGTVSPTHYIVVYDSGSMKPDHMQRLAYKLTHMYYNWPGTVRVPAPCQYAHKLCQMVGMHLHNKEPKLELAHRLFYL